MIVAAVGITGYLVIDAHRHPASQSAPTYRQTVLPINGLSTPYGVAVGTAGDVYVSEGDRVLKLTAGSSP